MKSIIVLILLLGISAIIFPDVFAHNTDFFVSAENPQFKNHFAGPMIIEVMVNGTNFDEKTGEPNVTVDGKTMQMVEAKDKNWYGYFASKIHSLTADGVQDSKIGKGLDFGIGLTTSCSFHLGINKTEASGVFVPRVAEALEPSTPGILSNCNSKKDYKEFGKQNMNVLRNAPEIKDYSKILNNLNGTWPFIQLFDFTPTENVIVQYQKDGTTLGVNLIFDALPDLKDTKLQLDGKGYYPESHVHLNVTDFQLNIDPTSKDSWTWVLADSGGLFYQVFDGDGISDGDGIPGAVDISPVLTDLMFGDNGKLVLDQNEENFSSTVKFTDNGLQKIAPVDAGFQSITFTESGENSGIFQNSDGEKNSNLVILPDAVPTGKWGFADELKYNGEFHLILILHGNATMSWDKPEYSMNQNAILAINDQDLNKNSKKFDSFTVTVNSRANQEGVKLLLNETKEDSGSFKGKIKFVESNPSEKELLVFDGDTVRASYSDIQSDGVITSIEKITSIVKWNIEDPKNKLKNCGIEIDFPENIDNYFPIIEQIKKQLEDNNFDSDRVIIENTENTEFPNCTKLELTKTISIDINDLEEYYDIFVNDPFSFPTGLNKTLLGEIEIEPQIKKFCGMEKNRDLNFCHIPIETIKNEILNKKGTHIVSESLILGPKLNSTNSDTKETSLSFIEELTNSTFRKNSNSNMTNDNPSTVLHIPDVNLKDNLFPNAMAESTNGAIKILQQNSEIQRKKISFSKLSLEKTFHYLNGFTLGYGIEKTYSYEYKPWGVKVFFAKAHVEGGLGIGLRIPIDLTVKMQQNTTLDSNNNTQYDASYIINTKDLNSRGYKNLNLGPLKTFGGKEFNTYLGPAANVYVEILENPVDLLDKSLLPFAKPDSSDFIPPLGNKTITFSDFSVDILCDIGNVCIPRTLAELEFSVGLSPRISGDKITMSSIPIDNTQKPDEIVFSSNGQAKNSTFPILSSGNTIGNVKYHSNLHFVPKITVNLTSKLLPFPSVNKTLEIGEIKFTNIVFKSHHNTTANYTIPEDMLTMGETFCDGLKIEFEPSFLIDEEKMKITIEFNRKNVNYDILGKQNGKLVLDSPGEYLEDGKRVHTTGRLDSNPFNSDTPLDVTITFQGYGVDNSKTCAFGEKFEFKVVPEFGTIAMIIFGIAITSIIALTFRSKIITRF